MFFRADIDASARDGRGGVAEFLRAENGAAGLNFSLVFHDVEFTRGRDAEEAVHPPRPVEPKKFPPTRS